MSKMVHTVYKVNAEDLKFLPNIEFPDNSIDPLARYLADNFKDVLVHSLDKEGFIEYDTDGNPQLIVKEHDVEYFIESYKGFFTKEFMDEFENLPAYKMQKSTKALFKSMMETPVPHAGKFMHTTASNMGISDKELEGFAGIMNKSRQEMPLNNFI